MNKIRINHVTNDIFSEHSVGRDDDEKAKHDTTHERVNKL